MNLSKNISIIVIMLISSQLFAQLSNQQQIFKTGTTAAQFLKIGVDARAASLGNAFTAFSGDLSAMYWNPAGLADIQGAQVLFVNNDWLHDISMTYLAFAFDLRNLGVIGASITALGVPDEPVRTVEEPDGTGEYYDVSDLAISFSYARRLSNKFSIGGNVKYIQQKIWHSSAKAVAIDFGSLFVTPFNNIRIGASLSNWGNVMQMTGRDLRISVDPDPVNEGNVEFINSLYETDKFPLPLMFRVGISGEIIQTDQIRVSFGLDAMHPNDNVEAVNAGTEFAFAETFFLRCGYANLFREESEEGFSFGGGIHYRIWGSTTVLKMDYSYTVFSDLGGVPRLSVAVKF